MFLVFVLSILTQSCYVRKNISPASPSELHLRFVAMPRVSQVAVDRTEDRPFILRGITKFIPHLIALQTPTPPSL